MENIKCNWFWQNYKIGQDWVNKHETAYWKSHAQALKSENDTLLQTIHDMQVQFNAGYQYFEKIQSQLGSSSSLSQSKNSRSRSKRTRRRHKKQQRPKREERDSVEISPEMLDFLKKSIEHKKVQKKQKDEEEKKKSLFTPPEESMDSRLKEMEQLYGEGCAKIMGMETVMTLSYERFIDHNNPDFWPSLPLNRSVHL